MPALRVALVVLCVGLLAPAAVRGGSPEDAVKSAYDAWDAAFNAGDAKVVASFYVDSALFLPASHEIINGPAGVETFFAGLLANGVTGHKLELIEATDSADLIVAAAKWSAQGKDSSGAPATFSGIATHVFAKQGDGSLKLKLHTFN
jgi:ketosteroid isomerase-like protein